MVPTLCATTLLIIAYWVMNRLAARFHGFSVLVKGKPLRLVGRGTPDTKTMRRRGVSAGDLDEAARLSGLSSADELDEAVLERNGAISTIARRRDPRNE